MRNTGGLSQAREEPPCLMRFDEMLRLKRENMILEDENKTLKKKLQKAYDFMKRFTINGLNMLESFFAIYWGKNA